MKDLLSLLRYSLRRTRWLIIGMGLLLAGFQFILIAVARSIQSSDAFGQLDSLIPAFAKEMMGPAAAGMMSFKGIVCLGYFHVAVMGSLVGLSIAVATVPASEVETGFADLILSRSVARHWIITRSILVSTICTAAILTAMMAGTWTGLRLMAPASAEWPSTRLVTSLAGNLALLMLCWSGVAMALGSVMRRRSVAAGLAGLAALATFLLDYLARMWKSAEPLGWWSPFRYYSPFDLLAGTPIPFRSGLTLAAVATAGYTLAYILFARRDISR